MSLDRETLAAQVFVMSLASCEFATEKLVNWAFDQADMFLAYAEKQRKQPEPQKCECRPWEPVPGTNKYKRLVCNNCMGINNFISAKEELAPKREMRTPGEWWICPVISNTPGITDKEKGPSDLWIKVRVVL